jgi:hypothetical protein
MLDHLQLTVEIILWAIYVNDVAIDVLHQLQLTTEIIATAAVATYKKKQGDLSDLFPKLLLISFLNYRTRS